MSDYRDNDNLDRYSSELHPDLWLRIEAQVRADRSELLLGLEAWLQLGLISQAQVKKIARHNLCCPLPTVEPIPSEATAVTETSTTPLLTAATPAPSLWQSVWQSFLDELSIRWLLFLGIFLVIVSSGGLAASQWQNFPDYAQYLILWLYSLGFWGIAFWTGKQSDLKLTAQTLRAIATLLMPINFWAISYLGLLLKPVGWGIVALAVITLSATRYLVSPKQGKHLASGLFLLLSYLHLGWQVSNLPLFAIYGGIMAIIGLHYQKFVSKRKYPLVDLLYLLAAWLTLLVRELITVANLPDYSLAIALFAWTICTIYLYRVRQTKLVALQHKSLAIVNALVGKVIKILAGILLMLSWWASLRGGIVQSELFFWQNVAIGGLAIQLFWQRLILNWRKLDLTAIFWLGLQTLYLSKELIPDRWRSQALDLSIEVSNSTHFPESVLGVSLFPYLILFVFVASWLYRRQKKQLGLYTEYLTLLLGIGFTCLSYVNPTWRSLNFLFSTLTLGYVASIRMPIRSSLVYAAHLLGLITIVQAIALILPNLNSNWWGAILLLLMVANWGVYLVLKPSKFKPMSGLIARSCWYAGLLLSAISYTCFLAEPQRSAWGLVWLITPVTATLVSRYTHKIEQRRLATVISCLALVAAQLLVYDWQWTRIISLAIATVLMLPNAFNLRRLSITLIHLGLAIALFANLFTLFVEPHFDNYPQWLLISSLAIVLLYRLRLTLLKIRNTPRFGYISQRSAYGILGVGRETTNFKLVDKYIKATNYWAIALIILELPMISLPYFWLSNLAIDGRFFTYLFATALLTWILIWRYRSDAEESEAQPNNLVLYTLTWLVGILAIGLVRIVSSSTLIFASSNILLGFAALIAMVLLVQSNTAWRRLDLAFVPLIYAALAIFWRLSHFNAYTGLLTLGTAIIMLSVRPQNRQTEKVIKYLGLTAISAGIYELVIYQMQSASGGSAADALTILSLVAAAIAFSYRLTVYWYAKQTTPTIFNLSLAKLTLIAHFHWAISSIFKVVAAGIAIESNTPRLTLVSIATSICLGAYAVIQGRSYPIELAPNVASKQDAENTKQEENIARQSDWWVYVGLVEIAATLVYSRLIIARLSLFDPWRILITCAIALLIYQIPWHNFGWRSTPWQRTAIAMPALMALVMAEDISYFSLLITALFYLRIAYAQHNIRWSYISLGLVNWLVLRATQRGLGGFPHERLLQEAIVEYSFGSIWISAVVCCSLLYLAQFDPYLQSQRHQRHYLRLAGSSILCLTTLFQQPGILPGIIALGLILLGLGLRIRAFLFIGTVTFVLTVLHQLIVLVSTYSFLKRVVGLLTGISLIAIAAGFEKKRDSFLRKFRIYQSKLQNWQ
ncbi:MAG: hypothetical protein AAFO95_01810 [Cyanobacteria bacterium J06600_6]